MKVTIFKSSNLWKERTGYQCWECTSARGIVTAENHREMSRRRKVPFMFFKMWLPDSAPFCMASTLTSIGR